MNKPVLLKGGRAPLVHDPGAITWKPYEEHKAAPVAAWPCLEDGSEFTPIIGAGLRRLCLRAFRLAEDKRGKPTPELWQDAPSTRYIQVILNGYWSEVGDPPADRVTRLPGLPGWWWIHPEILAD